MLRKSNGFCTVDAKWSEIIVFGTASAQRVFLKAAPFQPKGLQRAGAGYVIRGRSCVTAGRLPGCLPACLAGWLVGGLVAFNQKVSKERAQAMEFMPFACSVR